MNAENLHIAHYTNVYKPMANGVVTSVESLRMGQLSQGHSVYVVAPSSSDKNYVQERFVFNVAAITLPNQAYPFALPYDPTISSVLRGLQPDLLHTHHPVGLGRYARSCSQRLGVPLVFTFHTWYEDFAHYFSRYVPLLTNKQVRRFIRYRIHEFLKQCHHVVAPSKHTKSRILECHGGALRAQDISVVPTGVDCQLFGSYQKSEARKLLGWGDEEKVLVSCGRLSPEKNFHLLVDALSKMEERARLVILGEGDLRGELEKQIGELGLQSRVSLQGNVDRNLVSLSFSASDAFAFASPNETQGLAALEAMACRTPAVVVGEGGLTDFIKDGHNGFSTENSAEALAAGLDKALRASDLSELVSRARQTAVELSVERQVNRMAEVYSKAKVRLESFNPSSLIKSSVA